MCADELNKIVITGTVEKKNLGGLSKSSHVGFVLQTATGPIKLRREGGNPYYDEFFERYEHQKIQVEGYDMDQYFLVTDMK